MRTNHIESGVRPKRRALISVVSSVALLGAGAAALVLAGGGSASAVSTADLSLSQSISGSSTAGTTLVNVTVHNAGSSTATGVSLSVFLKSTSTTIGTHASFGTCSFAPPPTGFLGFSTCSLGSIASGASVKETFTYSGNQGKAFSNFATVGLNGPADPNYKNNSSTISSWFGPRADLAISGTAGPGTTAGSGVASTTVVNHGPNTANALQLITEIKSTGIKGVTVSASPVSSCQIIPPASGYNMAVSCVTNALAIGQKWVLSYKYSGAKGAAITEVSHVTANNPIDPVTTNNSMTKTTTLHS